MDDQSLRNALALMRQLQSTSPTTTFEQFCAGLAENAVSPAITYRIAAYIMDEISRAHVVVNNSRLTDEAKAGLASAFTDLTQSFSLMYQGHQVSQIQPRLPGYISNLVILLSAAGIQTEQILPQEATDLAAEIDAFNAKFDDPHLDPVVRDVAKKHLATLSTLLRHIPIFGLEASLLAYFELITKLRRADSQTTPEAKAALDPLMEKVKTWGGRLSTIDEIVNKGANLIERAKGMAPLLQYLPGIAG